MYRASIASCLILVLSACSDDGGGTTTDGPVGDGAVVDGKQPTEGPVTDGPVLSKPCGFTVGDTLKKIVGDNKDFVIGGVKRTFIVQLVNVPQGYSKKLPVVFGFHGTGSYYNIATKYFELLSENRPFIYVVPLGSGTFEYPWDFTADPTQNKDIKFFDDMLQCLKAQFDVNPDQVHAFGFSWGGHWINYLLAHRGSVLASAAQLSSGAIDPAGAAYEAFLAKNNPKPAQLVIWGGVTDQYNGYSFDQTCKDTVASFLKQGYFVVQCIHSSGHDITPPESLNKFIFEFFQDHPRGVSPEPYLGWPPSTPFTIGTYLKWPTWCEPVP